MARRLAPTLADYMAIAISPALIMGLVGSLAFFLLDLTYRGEHADRLQWILSWFVMAIVLIARIAIVEGGERAAIFGLALAGVMMLAVLRFAPGFLWLTPFLLALIWWCAHELTWNCTWIDDDEDPGGEGLLQAAGLDRPEGSDNAPALTKPASPPEPGTRREKPWWQRLSTKKRRRARAPGVTVVWFSLAALPIFGLGQLAIPAAETARRQHVFWLATIYVGCGLGLLLNTAFLGLRRYLRRRGLEMPASISGGWLTLGGLMIAALLVAGALLPRPSAEYSLAQVAVDASREVLEASRWAALSGSAGEGEGAAGGEGKQEAQQTGAAEGQGEPGGKKGQDASSGQATGQGSQGRSGDKGGQGKSSSQGKSSGKSQTQGGDKRSGDSKGQGDKGDRGDGRQGQDAPASQSEPGEKSDGSKSQGGEKAGEPRGDKTGEDQKSQAKGEGKQGESSKRRSGGGSGSQSGKSSRNERSEPSAAAKPPGEAPSSQPLADIARQASNALQSLSGIAQALKWLLVAAAVCFFVWQFGPELLRMLNGLLAWLRTLFGGATDEEAEAELPTAAALRRLSFAQFGDPFLSGVADRSSPEQLVTYTFAALEAWGREVGSERTEDQTPLEFAGRVTARFPQLDPSASQTAEFYTYLAYGPGRLTPHVRGPLEALWQALRSESAAARGEFGHAATPEI